MLPTPWTDPRPLAPRAARVARPARPATLRRAVPKGCRSLGEPVPQTEKSRTDLKNTKDSIQKRIRSLENPWKKHHIEESIGNNTKTLLTLAPLETTRKYPQLRGNNSHQLRGNNSHLSRVPGLAMVVAQFSMEMSDFCGFSMVFQCISVVFYGFSIVFYRFLWFFYACFVGFLCFCGISKLKRFKGLRGNVALHAFPPNLHS